MAVMAIHQKDGEESEEQQHKHDHESDERRQIHDFLLAL
jgi:hypothetical protein